MLKRIFHRDNDAQLSASSGQSQLEGLLARIVADVPEAQWAALVKSNGILVGMYPSSAGLSAERISAMSVAAEVLGERITKELTHGTFRHALLAGSNGTNLVIALNNDYCLSVSLRTAVALHQAFETLHPSLSALQDLLGRSTSARENGENFS